jgi:hypothetical protein
MSGSEFLTSGQLAAFVGRSRETIRRYEALGLIPKGRRDPINKRRYWSEDEAETIRRSLQPLPVEPDSETGTEQARGSYGRLAHAGATGRDAD